jgi:hypothetical protein
MVAGASGRDDIQSMAIALDAEATRLAGTWTVTVTADGTGHVEAHLTAGDQPVAGVPMAFLVSGRDDPVQVTTDVDGVATADVAIQAGTMTVAASAPAPGPAVVYRGTPAGPDPQGAQRLVTGGTPIVASATATVEVPPDTTSTTSTTTTTDAATTTTELASTSTSSTTSTAELATTAVAETTPTTIPVETTPVVPVVAVHPPRSPLPKTGRRTDGIAYLATGLLVAGIGIVGAVSRRPRKAGAYTP